MELDEARKLAINCVIVALESNPHVKATMTQNDKDRLLDEIKTADLATLSRRLAAIGEQNPGCLAEALKRCGYKITPDGMGGIAIDPNAGSDHGSIGSLVTKEQFDKL